MKVALHDHNYAASGFHGVVAIVTNDHSVVEKLRLRPCAENCVENSLLKQAKLSLNVICGERMLTEQNTRTQIQSPEWFAMRAIITGLKCGKILCQNERTVALLTSVLYTKPLLHIPAIDWGTKHESSACAAYVK